MPAPIPINQLATLYGQQPQPWDQLSPLNKLAAIFSTSVPEPPAPDQQTDLPFEAAFQQAAARHFTPPAQPTPWRDVVAALGNVAQMGIMGRGGFGAPPYSKVMEGGKPKRVYHGTPFAYQKMDPQKAGKGAGGDLYGPSPGGYWTESPEVAGGYSRQDQLTMRMGIPRAELEQFKKNYPDAFVIGGGPEWVDVQIPPQSNIRVAYLDITKPFDINEVKPVGANIQSVNDALLRRGQKPIMSSGSSDPLRNDVLWNALDGRYGVDVAQKVIQEAGFDGITHIGRSGARQWIPFRADQIHEGFQPPK